MGDSELDAIRAQRMAEMQGGMVSIREVQRILQSNLKTCPESWKIIKNSLYAVL